MDQQELDDEACLRLLSAVVLQWWRDGHDLDLLAWFLEIDVDEVRRVRPLRIDGWRRNVLER